VLQKAGSLKQFRIPFINNLRTASRLRRKSRELLDVSAPRVVAPISRRKRVPEHPIALALSLVTNRRTNFMTELLPQRVTLTEGPAFWFLNNLCILKATSESTSGSFSMVYQIAPPGMLRRTTFTTPKMKRFMCSTVSSYSSAMERKLSSVRVDTYFGHKGFHMAFGSAPRFDRAC